MPVGRYFRGLTAYDLLGNVVPGLIALLAIVGFLPNPPLPTTLGGYGLFVVIAFGVGAIIQAHASRAIGERQSFDKTMESVEQLPNLITTDSETTAHSEETTTTPDSESDADSTEHWLWPYLHPVIGPVAGWKRPNRGSELEDRILANRIWRHLIDTHEIQFETKSYNVLYHVMSSTVDDAQSPSRATRIQAIRNFHRGMWITAWYSSLLLLIAGLIKWGFSVGETIPVVGVSYFEPAYFDYWQPLWHLQILALGGVIVFWQLFESSEEDYIEYLFADYAVAISKSTNNITFDDNPHITISGNIHTPIGQDQDTDNDTPPEDTSTEPDGEET